MFVRTADHNFRRGDHLSLDVFRNGDKDRMREPQLHDQTLSRPPGKFPPRIVLHSSTITHSDEVQWNTETFRHTDDGIINECPRETPHRSLFFLLCILDRDSERLWFGEVELNEWMEKNGCRSQRSLDRESRWGRCQRDICWILDSLFSNIRNEPTGDSGGAEGTKDWPELLRPEDHRNVLWDKSTGSDVE